MYGFFIKNTNEEKTENWFEKNSNLKKTIRSVTQYKESDSNEKLSLFEEYYGGLVFFDDLLDFNCKAISPLL